MRILLPCFLYNQNYDFLSQYQVGYPVRDLLHAIPVRAFYAHLF